MFLTKTVVRKPERDWGPKTGVHPLVGNFVLVVKEKNST
jgi:hypothetical protein